MLPQIFWGNPRDAPKNWVEIRRFQEDDDDADEDEALSVGASKLADFFAAPQVHITSTWLNIQTIFLFSLDLKDQISGKKAATTESKRLKVCRLQKF